jgi:hypothetical protein
MGGSSSTFGNGGSGEGASSTGDKMAASGVTRIVASWDGVTNAVGGAPLST